MAAVHEEAAVREREHSGDPGGADREEGGEQLEPAQDGAEEEQQQAGIQRGGEVLDLSEEDQVRGVGGWVDGDGGREEHNEGVEHQDELGSGDAVGSGGTEAFEGGVVEERQEGGHVRGGK